MRKPRDPADSLSKLLFDPLTQMVMRADGVTEDQLSQTINLAFANRPPASDRDQFMNKARANYRPSVGIMLLNQSGQVFVGRRKNTQGDSWQMPQGGIEDGEDPLEAAFRELVEEVGTDKAELIAESASWLFYDVPAPMAADKGEWRGQRQKWFAMRFTGQNSDIDIETDVPEFSEWRWVSFDSLPDLIVPFKRLVYLSVLEEFTDIV